ncbi:hypothetical protein CTAYLR_001154 [Chrysophaeum taylorii]|uniref:Major facilitator superfamily (MFS) profile domain-containing protein n=1 Tax=Chrysophaeum taylorii TaxID=2483200 RepID=A0AAD7UPD2_9STRA|nr:hypothetical protein CTAYLR_001154 [Chrysophaeum taylorii]
MMVVLCLTNLVNYVDRGIIPGAADRFTDFIAKSGQGVPGGANMLLGALQSAFIVGFSLGSVAIGHAVHAYSPFWLSSAGLATWCAAACGAGAARSAGSYTLLFVARCVSGVGEAGFVTVGGPYIQDSGGAAQGKWLGAFYAMVPTGTALGYGYGTLVADTWNWSYCFFVEALLMAPLAAAFFVSRDDGAAAFKKMDDAEDEDDSEDDDRRSLESSESVDWDEIRGAMGFDRPVPEHRRKPLSFVAEALLCLRQPCFPWVGLGYAGYAGSIIGFSTFAPSIAVGLGLWGSQSGASISFSATIAVSGILGTPLGGALLDKWTERRRSTTTRIVAALELALGFVASGFVVVAYACLATDRATFLGRLFVGTLPLFAATAPMNVAMFESVPRENRALGQALGVLIMHALGDVPTPIIVGALKDKLAPACTPRGAHDSLGDDCPSQRGRLRSIALACAAWLLWSLLAFFIAYFKAAMLARRNNPNLQRRMRPVVHAVVNPVQQTSSSRTPSPVFDAPLLDHQFRGHHHHHHHHEGGGGGGGGGAPPPLDEAAVAIRGHKQVNMDAT